MKPEGTFCGRRDEARAEAIVGTVWRWDSDAGAPYPLADLCNLLLLPTPAIAEETNQTGAEEQHGAGFGLGDGDS